MLFYLCVCAKDCLTPCIGCRVCRSSPAAETARRRRRRRLTVTSRPSAGSGRCRSVATSPPVASPPPSLRPATTTTASTVHTGARHCCNPRTRDLHTTFRRPSAPSTSVSAVACHPQLQSSVVHSGAASVQRVGIVTIVGNYTDVSQLVEFSGV